MTRQGKPPGPPGTDNALWQDAVRDVTPLGKRGPARPLPRNRPMQRRADPVEPMPDRPVARRAEDHLDRSWQQRIRRGRLDPERTLDLHGLNRELAWRRLMAFVGDAAAGGQRVLLVITGKGRGGAPGVLRQLVPGWLAASSHGPAIMAVKPAHPAHGGQGALYVILRRRRSI